MRFKGSGEEVSGPLEDWEPSVRHLGGKRRGLRVVDRKNRRFVSGKVGPDGRVGHLPRVRDHSRRA